MSKHQSILSRGRLRRQLRAAPEFTQEVRECAGLTQAELAQLLGVSQVAISRWERGRALPRAEALGRYVELLDSLEGQSRQANTDSKKEWS